MGLLYPLPSKLASVLTAVVGFFHKVFRCERLSASLFESWNHHE